MITDNTWPRAWLGLSGTLGSIRICASPSNTPLCFNFGWSSAMLLSWQEYENHECYRRISIEEAIRIAAQDCVVLPLSFMAAQNSTAAPSATMHSTSSTSSVQDDVWPKWYSNKADSDIKYVKFVDAASDGFDYDSSGELVWRGTPFNKSQFDDLVRLDREPEAVTASDWPRAWRAKDNESSDDFRICLARGAHPLSPVSPENGYNSAGWVHSIFSTAKEYDNSKIYEHITQAELSRLMNAFGVALPPAETAWPKWYSYKSDTCTYQYVYFKDRNSPSELYDKEGNLQSSRLNRSYDEFCSSGYIALSGKPEVVTKAEKAKPLCGSAVALNTLDEQGAEIKRQRDELFELNGRLTRLKAENAEWHNRHDCVVRELKALKYRLVELSK